jgi:ParB/RepB/Spo0J family partition protein
MTTGTKSEKVSALAGEVAWERCKPNTWNKSRPLDAAFVASIKDQGILSPLLLRRVPEDGQGRDLEIVCGERRWRAAQEAGLFIIPAMVRILGDQEAQLCTLIENTHREDMTPWQEAQLIGDLLSREDWDVAQVAAATGWSESMIRRRAELLKLSPAWRKSMEEGALSAWTIGHFEVLAIFDEKRQEELHKELHYRANGFSISELKEEIADRSRTLKAVPWDLEDVTLLPKAGACTACPKRSDAQSDLFSEVKEMVKAGASCLDDGCFGRKLAAVTKRKEAALLEKHPEAVKVSKNYGSGGKGALKPHQYTEAKKSDKGAVPALQYGDRGQVTLGYVKVKKSAEEREKSPKSQAKEAERQRQVRIDALAIEKLQAVIQDPDSEFTDEAYPLLVQYCLVHGAGIEIEEEEVEKRVRAFAKKPVKLEELWASAVDLLLRSLNHAKWSLERQGGTAGEDADVKFAAWMVDADFAALRREAEAELAAPNPESAGGEENAPKSKTEQEDNEDHDPYDGYDDDEE